jgi:uncharacterized membrane protein
MGCMGCPYLFGFCIYQHVFYYLSDMEGKEGTGMNWQGWVFMLIVWGIVSSLFFYSFYRILFDDRAGGKRKKDSRVSSNYDEKL